MKVWCFLITILMSSLALAQSPRTSFLGHQIDEVSESYLGRPYVGDPLGEGQGYDNDPLYRFDVFDCVTFVETVLAQAMSLTEESFIKLINEIRYKNAQVTFETRNHFTSVDWIKNNRKNGLIFDVTKRLFQNDFKISETVINRSAWFKKKHNMEVDARTTLSRLPYLPIQTAIQNPALLNSIRTGNIINIVRPNWDLVESSGTHLDISHQGFAIWKDGVLYFRNASTTAKVVQDEPLLQYLKRMTSIKSIGGINVLEARL